MKKYLFVLVFLSFLVLKPVKAEEATISYHRLDGIFFNLSIDGNFQSNHVTRFYLNDRIAYCIEPGVAIDTQVYDANTDWSNVSFSDEVKEYIEKVGYYGFEYPGHQNDRYYIAAQELIWKTIRPDMEVVWTTGVDNTGEIIDISQEKNEIEDLINSHSLLPSFALDNVKGYLGDEITLIDENGVLDYYEVSDSNNHIITRDGNSLSIKLNDEKVSSEEIVLTRKYYDLAPLLVYSKGDSQKLAALRITMDKSSYFTIENEELPKEEEVVEVPNTGVSQDALHNIFYWVSMILYAFKIN